MTLIKTNGNRGRIGPRKMWIPFQKIYEGCASVDIYKERVIGQHREKVQRISPEVVNDSMEQDDAVLQAVTTCKFIL